MSDAADTERPHVVVVGGGITGLAAAWSLVRNEAVRPRVTVLEASDRFGGKLHTTDFAGQRVDTGPDAFLVRTPWAQQLCEELGLSDQLVSPTKHPAYLWSRGSLVRFPDNHVLGVPAGLRSLRNSGAVSPGGIARACADYVLPRRPHAVDPSIGTVLADRLGAEVVDRIIDPLVGGINAGSIDALGFEAAPQLKELTHSHRSFMRAANSRNKGTTSSSPGFATPRDGLSTLVDALVTQLRNAGAALRTDVVVTSLHRNDNNGWLLRCADEETRADAVIVTTPAFDAAPLLQEVCPRAAEQLKSIRYASVALMRLAYKASDIAHPLKGSGFVVPAVEDRLLTACSWASSKWEHLGDGDQVIFRASAGRMNDHRPSNMDDDELISAAAAELSEAIGASGLPIASDVTRWHQGFPQYEVGHDRRVGAIESAVSDVPGLAVAGAAYRGLGIPACVKSAIDAVQAIFGDLRGPKAN